MVSPELLQHYLASHGDALGGEPAVVLGDKSLTYGELEEASTRLRVKDQTLKSRLHRGQLMLRERLRAFTTGLSLHRPTPAYS